MISPLQYVFSSRLRLDTQWLIALALITIPLAFSSAMSAPLSRPDRASAALDEILQFADTAFATAALEELDFLAPDHYRKATDEFRDVRSQLQKRRDESVIRIKLNVAIDDLDAARKAASTARRQFSEALMERESARDVGADTLTATLWQKAEKTLRDALHAFERDGETKVGGDGDIAGAYRAARRESLRAQILTLARNRIDDAEKRGAERLSPTMLLRAHQALSRAEAYLAQEKLDSAKISAAEAIAHADHIEALITYIETAQKSKTMWEAALLPYDDLLADIAVQLNGNLDLSKGGAACGPQLRALIKSRTDSLAKRVDDQQHLMTSLEQSLAESQTSLADAQGKISELEQRLRAVEGDRTSARDALQTRTQTTERITNAQAVFQPGEAVVLQNADGSVTIRLQTLQFTSGATKLTKSHQRILDRVAVASAQFPKSKLRIEGHTDSEGGEELNQRLSEQRATSVGTYLAKGLKIKPQDIDVIGYGESKPIADNKTAAGRSQNRRIDIVLTPQ